MAHVKPGKSRLLLLLILLVALFAGAQVYKWVDEKGQVHFGDCPPADCEMEEMALPQGPSDEEIEAAQEELRKTLESRKSSDEAQQEQQRKDWSEEYAGDLRESENFKRCVEARYQVAVLERRGRAFKLDRNWTRIYLEDEDRPAEISRLKKRIKTHCGTAAESVKKQNIRVAEMKKALNIRCVAARERLHKGADPAAKIDKQDLQEAQDYIELKCPDVGLHDLWIGDWIFVRRP